MKFKKKSFSGKRFTSLTTLWVFLIMGFSGIILYVRPEGSLADEINWTFLSLTKKGWEGIHTIFVFFFIIVIPFHLFFNWNALMRYFGYRKSGGFILKSELIISLAIVVLILFAAILQLMPFWKLVEWRGELKQWDRGKKITSSMLDNNENKQRIANSFWDLYGSE